MRQVSPYLPVFQPLADRHQPLTTNLGAAVKHTPKVIYRDSRDGQFVPKPWANQHPRITEREIVYTPSPKKDGK
jgi:hypothetical protein